MPLPNQGWMYAGGPGGDPSGLGGLISGLPMSGASNSIQTGLFAPPQGGSLSQLASEMAGGNAAYQLGPWARLAYQMAGSPMQGPYPTVPVPAGSGSSGSVGTAAGLGGLFGAIAQNPALATNLGKAISGLLGPQLGSPAWQSSVDAGTAAGANQLPVTPIPAPSASDVASSIGAPANGDLYAGAQNADADLAAQEADNYAANGGLAGLLNAPATTPPVTGSGNTSGTAAGSSTGGASISATTSTPTAGGLLGDVQSGLGIATGLLSGTPAGDASAALSAAKLGSATGLLPSQAGAAAGAAAPVLGLISGIQQGGPMGDAQAAESAGQLANSAGLLGSSAGAALGAAGLGLGVASVPFLLNALLPDPTDVPNFNDIAFIQSLAGTPGSSYLQQAAASYFNQHGTLDGNFWQSIGVNPNNPGMVANPEPTKRTVQS